MPGKYSDNNPNITNMRSLSSKSSKLFELRICEMSEYIDGVLARIKNELGEPENIYEALSVLSDETFCFIGEGHADSLDINRTRLSRHGKNILREDRALACELILEALMRAGIVPSESDFLPCGERPDVIAYVKGALADEAYDVFSEELSDPRVVYCENFKEAIRAILTGEAGYCILPLEESGGVRLHGISEYIHKSDLKINSVTPVFGFDGSADMKYALLSLSFAVGGRSDDDRYLEIRLPVDTALTIDELLSVAAGFGHSVYRVNTESLPGEEGESSFYTVVFRDGGAGFTLLLTYLTLFSDSYTAVGVYNNLE